MTELRTEFVEKHYWSCHNEKHRHQTREVAEHCARTRKVSKYPKWTKEQLEELVSLRDAGMTYKELGKKFSRTPALMRGKYLGTRMRMEHEFGFWMTEEARAKRVKFSQNRRSRYGYIQKCCREEG